MSPGVWETSGSHDVTDEYVRRFWTAAIGPGAVADLLRLATAARRGRSLPRPVNLPALVSAGLVRFENDGPVVRIRIPTVPRALQLRMPPDLRREHSTAAPACE